MNYLPSNGGHLAETGFPVVHSPEIYDGLLNIPAPAIPHSASPKERDMRAVQIDIFQKLIDGLPEQIALLDAKWNVLAVNSA